MNATVATVRVLFVVGLALPSVTPLPAAETDCRWMEIYPSVLVSNDKSNVYLTGYGDFYCLSEYGTNVIGTFDARVSIIDEGSGNTLASTDCGAVCDQHSGTSAWHGIANPTGEFDHCYRTYASAVTPWYNNRFGSSQACAASRPTCHLTIYTSAGGGNVPQTGTGDYTCGTSVSLTATANTGYHFVSWTGDYPSSTAAISFTLNQDMTVNANFDPDDPRPPGSSDPVNGPGTCNDPSCMGQWEPLILDLNGDGVRTTGTDAMVWFDLNGDGVKEHITWTDGSTAEGFLWIDLFGKNRVDSGSELFGIGTVLPDGSNAKDGFGALALYDQASFGGNSDGSIDAHDAAWSQLRVWIDANHNALCEPGEVWPLARFGVEGISLAAVKTTFIDPAGNGHFLKSQYWRRVGGRVSTFDVDGVTFQGTP